MTTNTRQRKLNKNNYGIIERYNDTNKDDIDDHISYVDSLENIKKQLPSKYSSIQYIIHTLREIRKNKITYILGFFACFIVVFVVALMVSVLSHAPIVFLNLAELESGEMDLYILPQSSTGFDFLNYTLACDIVKDQNEYSYSSPRRILDKGNKQIEYYNPNNCLSIINEYDFIDWVYNGIDTYTYPNCTDFAGECFKQLCSNGTEADSYFIDSKREWNMKLGHSWPKKDNPIPIGEIYISRELHDNMGIHTGDILYVRIHFKDIFYGLWEHTIDDFLSSEEGELYTPEDVEKWKYSFAPLTVTYDFKESYGKLPSDYGNVVFYEYDTLLDNFKDYFPPSMPKTLKNTMLNWDLYEYAPRIIFNYPPDERYDLYTDSNTDNINEQMVNFASTLAFRLGFGQIHTVLDVLDSLNDLEIFSLFLGLILNVITFILLFLSILLIYSLLMVSVETRTFEMGILRMIGMTRIGLVQLLLIQAFLYALPAWILGLIFAQIGGYLAEIYFNNLTGIPLNANITFSGFIAASILGLLIPIISSILPIKNALGQNLHDAVDSRRSKSKAVEIQISRSEDKGMSIPLLLIGIFLTIFGFSIYYIIPLALLAEQLSLLLNMFFALLIMMLLGLVMLALNFQRILEKLVTEICFWWDRPALRTVVLKNLIAHRTRNRKTTIMYALSLGFIIFIYVSYDVQIRSFIYQEQWDGGTYLNVHAPQYSYSSKPNKIDIVPELEQYCQDNKAEYAWATQPLRYVVPFYDNVHITNIGHVFRDWNDVYGVSPNYFDVAIPGFLQISEQNKSSEFPLLTQLYTSIGTGSALVGTLYKKVIGLDSLDDQFLVEISKSNEHSYQTEELIQGTSYYRLKTCAFLNGCAGFKFSKFPTLPDQDMLISIPTYLRLTEGAFQSIDDIPLGYFFIRIKDTSDENLDKIKKDLKSLISDSRYSLSVHDYRKNLDIIDQVDLAMRFFFGFTVIVAMAISFFSLISSMYTNIHEQAKEIGILRALGIPYGWMQRIYVYEAFVLVLSSSIMGMGIGIGVGWTVAIQRVLFTQLPVPFEFPIILFVIIFIMAIIFSIISSYTPITVMMRKSIVGILRTQ